VVTAPPTRRATPTRARPSAGARVAAATLPVARVLVEVPLPHLDRTFDYLVDRRDDDVARPGVRVKVRFAGRQVGGFVIARVAESDHTGELGFIERVVSPEPVLSAEVAELARAVADRYGGTVADVLRLAVPPRHARAEKQLSGGDAPESVAAPPAPGPGDSAEPGPGITPDGSETAHRGSSGPPVPPQWSADYPAGAAFFKAIRDGRPARAVWEALPGEDWPTRFAEAAAAAMAAGRGALLIVPDATDLARLDAALIAVLGPDRHVILSADLGPAERYRRFLAVRRGERMVVAGTRAAAFAPVAGLGLVAVFDDGDDLLAEPRAPYPHVREVLMLRSMARSCPMLIGGFARTAESQLLLDSGWAQAMPPYRPLVRSRVPWIRATGTEHVMGATSAAAHARIPPVAFDAARKALDGGAPVLIQVPRAGYVPAVACERCRRPARCRRCRGHLRLTGPRTGLLHCRWCGANEAHFRCGACGGDRIRASTIGARRTAEEIGRAFPGVPILNSSQAAGRPTVPDGPAIVVATPGAEPVAPTGYGAALLLDGRLLLGRQDLRAAEETLRRWMGAAALVRSNRRGGQVVIAAEAALPTVQALIRWDPAGHAGTELAARRELGFPPAVAMASIDGSQTAIMDALDRLQLPPDAEILGPVPLDEDNSDPTPDPDEDVVDGSGALLLGLDPALPDGTRLRALVRAPLAQRKSLSAALHALAAGRSARKLGGGLRIKVDPAELV
jgi:primosomal protein N' (replication factor Y)